MGLAALGAVLVLSAPVERAAALSLSNPAAATAVQDSAKVTTEVHWHHHGWHHHGWHRGWYHRHWHQALALKQGTVSRMHEEGADQAPLGVQCLMSQ